MAQRKFDVDHADINRHRRRPITIFKNVTTNMNTSAKQSVSVRAGDEKVLLSKDQKAFNRLIKQIETRRATLAQWQQVLPEFDQKVASDLFPQLDKVADLQRQMVQRLDRISEQKGWKRAERKMMSEMICDITDDILRRGDDAELLALHNKHRTEEMDEQDAEAINGTKDMLERMFGVDLSDEEDLTSPDEVFARAHEKLEQRQQQEQAEAKPRKKTDKQLDKEAKQKAETTKLSQSVREIYRKLVSALHPDREPDVQERERKTELMKRVNEAYQNNNLLRLLELQLELEHIDQTAINNISTDKLKLYNKILKDQLNELEQELADIEMDFEMKFASAGPVTVKPDNVLQMLAAEVRRIKRNTAGMKKELQMFDDVKATKIWVKEMTRAAQMRADEFPYFD